MRLKSSGSEYKWRFVSRRCPGRHLALDSIYLVATTMLAMFDIAPAKDEAGNSTLKCSFGGKLLMYVTVSPFLAVANCRGLLYCPVY
jgi:hypothetical protein